MDKKIIVVEKTLHQRKILQRKLDSMLQATILTFGEADIAGVSRELDPDAAVIYLNGMELSDMAQLKTPLSESGWVNENLILLGTEEECSECRKVLGVERCIEIRRPISINNFVLSLKAILNCECREKIQLDVYKRDILVVDDNPISLKSLKLWLEDTFCVSIVNSGKTALKFLEKKSADLILMDYMMPGMDGKETLRKLRENPKTKDIPVFFLTDLSDNSKIVDVMNLNAQGYFLKTAQKEEIVTAIASFLDVL